MMFGAILLSALAGQAVPPKITFDATKFKVTGALGTDVVALASQRKVASPIDHSKGRFQITVAEKTVTFDAKGLTISTKGHAATSKMTGVPTSGKIATKESNEHLIQLVSEKKRKLEVSALSGWELIDKSLLLLLRWEGSDKKPWLEALMRVDLTEKRPQAKLVARFDGLSFAQGRVDDIMVRRADKLAILANKDDSFGVSRLTPDGKKSEFEKLGPAVSKAKLCEDEGSAWTLTPTEYGTNILGVAELDQSSYHVVSEFRGKMVGVFSPSYARYQTVAEQRMVNLLTGAEMTVDRSSGQHHTVNGLLVWTPAVNPRTAALYDPSFRKLATWVYTAPPVTVPPAAKKPTAKPGAGRQPVKNRPPVKATNPAKTKTPPSKPTTTGTKAKVKKPKLEIEVTSRPSTKKRG